MLPKRGLAVCAVVLLIAVVPASAQEREELLANLEFEEDARQPVFSELAAEEVAAAITMTSGRNYAWFGFNTPEIHLVLPAADNSVYAVVDFGTPRLFDTDGNEVPHEIEHGLYDHETHHAELRFLPVEGDQAVDFKTATGTAHVRYPLRVRTLKARAEGPPVEGLDVSFDGPYVTRRTASGDESLDEAPFTGITAFRALDAEGRRLKRVPSTKMSVVGSAVTEVFAYWGEVASVEHDVVDEWGFVQVDYELPSVAPLPEVRAGLAPEDGNENPATPGAVVEAKAIEQTAGMAAASELGISAADAVERLRELGFASPSGDFMVMSAVQGRREALELFLAAGYPVDHTTDDGRTALTSAVMYGQNDIALFLIEAGADVNIPDANNSTPLTHAAGKCDAIEVVRALLEAGADPNPATRGGITAAQMARIMSCADNEAVIKAAGGG